MHPLSFRRFLKSFTTAQGIQGAREVSKVRAQDFNLPTGKKFFEMHRAVAATLQVT